MPITHTVDADPLLRGLWKCSSGVAKMIEIALRLATQRDWYVKFEPKSRLDSPDYLLTVDLME